MAKIWRIVLISVLVLLVAGALLAGAGLLTGASPERVWTALGLEVRIGSVLEAARSHLP